MLSSSTIGGITSKSVVVAAGPTVEALVTKDNEEEVLEVLALDRQCRFGVEKTTSWLLLLGWEVADEGNPRLPSLH